MGCCTAAATSAYAAGSTGWRQLRSALQQLEVVQLESRLVCTLGSNISVLSDSSSVLTAIGNFPLSPCQVIWA